MGSTGTEHRWSVPMAMVPPYTAPCPLRGPTLDNWPSGNKANHYSPHLCIGRPIRDTLPLPLHTLPLHQAHACACPTL